MRRRSGRRHDWCWGKVGEGRRKVAEEFEGGAEEMQVREQAWRSEVRGLARLGSKERRNA